MKDSKQKTVAIITAGAGGMYCGSCLHDNFLAKGLRGTGMDAVLVPTYTPIRTDESNVSIDRVFFGGINVFLQEKVGLFRYMPKFVDRWLDRPGLIRWITSRKMDTDPSGLGPMTVSMLQGMEGRQRKEVAHLADWIQDELKPDWIVFSNMLIAGCAPELKRRVGCPILVTLQGDDVFLDGLPAEFKSAAVEQMQKIAKSVDGFLAHSQFYADYMSHYLGLDRSQMHQVTLGISRDGFSGSSDSSEEASRNASNSGQPVIGYLARLAPEKGLHLLCEAVAILRSNPETQNVKLKIAGWQDERHREYAASAIDGLRAAAGDDAVELLGEVTREEKIQFLQSIDVFSVPTEFQEPKGLYVLEALAAGVPVVQPNHGAFPELLGPVGGTLFQPNDAGDLARKLATVLGDAGLRGELAAAGQKVVQERHSSEVVGEQMASVLRQFG